MRSPSLIKLLDHACRIIQAAESSTINYRQYTLGKWDSYTQKIVKKSSTCNYKTLKIQSYYITHDRSCNGCMRLTLKKNYYEKSVNSNPLRFDDYVASSVKLLFASVMKRKTPATNNGSITCLRLERAVACQSVVLRICLRYFLTRLHGLTHLGLFAAQFGQVIDHLRDVRLSADSAADVPSSVWQLTRDVSLQRHSSRVHNVYLLLKGWGSDREYEKYFGR